MAITVAELESFKKSIELLTQLKSIPLEVIELYLEIEHGYIIKKPKLNEEKIKVDHDEKNKEVSQ
ncbi:MAG: hypothetical protein IPL59_03445 [Candidatus Competibacteraceae bacterium]|uniref:Uncharacterized protein n=1 Tax=Candidatus Contendobacter odensis Run_B_J11 TaxID=1400861 RepID=A0A7U7GCH4_9GAMM|nr:hypothetical protein [Candidatus Contendobacter odensis]MBK8534240.1 hypothetical protein [Candidatus Competibacteraceae bacterium]MBK8751984.1 hypothetical protein [Candidatus Competibacteraceae bacterium]CDH45820.1 hypothetical protein BN874_290061 [Candidatus Contendobacter odensis Run_B_J11]